MNVPVHVVHNMQQQYLMRKARHYMERNTVYIVLNRSFGPEVFEKAGMRITVKRGCSGLGCGHM